MILYWLIFIKQSLVLAYFIVCFIVPKISYYNIKLYDIILAYFHLTVFIISLLLFNSLFYSS